MKMSNKAYGYVNGKPVYSRDEFIYVKRGFCELKSDDELLAYATRVSCGWSNAGHKRTFTSFYLGDYALDEPMASLTGTEYGRLKKLQSEARERLNEEEKQKDWKRVETYYYADNSVEDVYENKYGERKTVMNVYPHGDVS